MPEQYHPYTPKDLPKVDALRKAKSSPSFMGIPILSEASVNFVTAASRENRPNWCGNCIMFNLEDKTCSILPEHIRIETFTIDPQKFWPVCGMHKYGKPNEDEPLRHEPFEDPDHVGLSWVNTKNDGREEGGTTCGGLNGGDDCDYYNTPGEDKREYEVGLCQVLQKNVGGGDCCSAWQDDDLVDWQTAQQHIKGSVFYSEMEKGITGGKAQDKDRGRKENGEEQEKS